MELNPVHINHANPLVGHYVDCFERVEDLFPYNPYQDASFVRRYRYLQENHRVDRTRLAAALRQYNEELGAGPAALANIDRLQRADTVVVITGQQAGMLTGPLYTVYKAISAIQLAARLEADRGWPVVPVFWVASEDHDFREVNHIELVTSRNNLMRVELAVEPPPRAPVGRIPLGDKALELLDRLAEFTPDTEFRGEILAEVRDLTAAAANMADWFARLMAWLFRRQGLVLVDPLLPEIKQLQAPMLRRFLTMTAEINAALREGESRVRAQGATPAVQKTDTEAHVFLLVEGQRCPLELVSGEFRVRGQADLGWEPAALASLADEEPWNFSPNVVLRPLAQDFILPDLAYVAGPGEISYHGQLRGIYPLFGLEMPIIYPRAGVTLVEGSQARLLQKHGLSLNRLLAGIDGVLAGYLDAQDSVGIEALFHETWQEFRHRYRRLIGHLAEIDPSLKGLGETNLRRIQEEMQWLEHKARQRHRQNCETVVRQLQKLGVSLAPRKNLQERVLNVFPYLFRHGADLPDRLGRLPLVTAGEQNHNLVFL